MPKFLLARIFSVVFVLTSLVVSVMSQNDDTKNRREAEKLWEQIIEAKGGREKLQSVTNLLVTKGDNPDNIDISLQLFPNKFWRWTKGPPLPKVVWIAMLNLDYKLYLVAGNDGLVSYKKLTKQEDIDRYKSTQLIEGCIYLLETKWLQPTPLRVTRQTIGKESLDVVETRFPDLDDGKNSRMDFFVEPEALTVRRVLFYYNYSADGKEPLYDYTFDDYININGIQMPRKIYYDYWGKKTLSYEKKIEFKINVKFDEQLFEKPPTVAAGSDAWKPKIKSQ